MEKTITNMFEDIKEDICDHKCRFPELYRSMYKDPDEADEYMMKEECERCQLQRL
jgi:hypothetical protein